MSDPEFIATLSDDFETFFSALPGCVERSALMADGRSKFCLARTTDGESQLMRFNRLDLFRYGGFQDRSITFPKSEEDFHVIHGHHEAGKSTMLAAIRDFQFKFPHHISADWISAARLLRVGGQVRHNGAVLEGIRRRARTQTFYAFDDARPQNDGLLRQWMGS